MTSEQFAYWLQGFAELNEQPPSAQQWQMVRDHLALVFDKRTPSFMGGRLGYPVVTAIAAPDSSARTIC